MIAIYDYENGYEISAGLQGSDVCDEAWQAATDHGPVPVDGGEAKARPGVTLNRDGLFY